MQTLVGADAMTKLRLVCGWGRVEGRTLIAVDIVYRSLMSVTLIYYCAPDCCQKS